LKLGDQCTSFFFKSINNNRKRSKITSLVLSDSTITHDMTMIKDTFVNFYSKLDVKMKPRTLCALMCKSQMMKTIQDYFRVALRIKATHSIILWFLFLPNAFCNIVWTLSHFVPVIATFFH